jgi:alpha-beta hydrolase superfamily lysophospholipase
MSMAPAPAHEAGTFRATPKWNLFWQRWTAPHARTPVVLLHGGGEHSGRHAGTAMRLVEAGYDVHAFDWPGHGHSPGVRGHIDRFEEFVEITAAFVRRISEQSGQPPMMLAHSLGGLAGTLYALEHGDRVRSLALSAPLWELALRVPLWKRVVAHSLVHVWPSMILRRPALGPGVLSHDPEVERRYQSDPLVHFYSSLQLYVGARRQIATLPARLPQLRVPTLVMAGGADRIASTPTTQALFPRIGAECKRLVIYPGFAHEILHELGKEQVIADLVAWFKESG